MDRGMTECFQWPMVSSALLWLALVSNVEWWLAADEDQGGSESTAWKGEYVVSTVYGVFTATLHCAVVSLSTCSTLYKERTK